MTTDEPVTAVVVVARPRMLHRADCTHLVVPNPGAGPSVTRPPTLTEARTLPVCSWCAQVEARS
jgi:hypothetical protein